MSDKMTSLLDKYDTL